jgi:hypothetical protein
LPCRRAEASAGSNVAIRIEMIPMTTSNSTRVNALDERFRDRRRLEKRRRIDQLHAGG